MQSFKDPEKRSYHHGDLRQAVIDTAMEMLNQGDDWQFTLREVARRAGVSHAAPYKHFPDKAALLAEIALIGFDRLTGAMEAAAAGPASDFSRSFMATAHAYIGFGRENPALYRLMFSGEIGAAHLDPRAVRTLEVVVGLMERGQAAGLVRKRSVRGQAAACWAQVHGLTMLMLDGLLIPEKVGDNAIETALAILGEGLDA